jgi:NAD(P)-dependent dehydrogenase (short-subunit alcohol dehydrogenase family)
MGSWISKTSTPTPPATKKVVLITGASSGIGHTTALHLLQQGGYEVYGAARRVQLMQDIVAAGGHALAMDVTNEQQMTEGVKRIIREQGKIDVLINNAALAENGSIEDVTMEDARRVMDVCLFGVAFLTKLIIPYMRQQKSGVIINVSSAAGKIYTPFGAWYQAAKHGLEAFSDCLRLELKDFNIKVVIIEPGLIDTGVLERTMPAALERSKGGLYEEKVKKMYANSLAMFKYASPSVLVAKCLTAAIEAKNPQRRYVMGFSAKPMLFIRKWLGDAVFDYLMLSNMR